MDLPLFDQVNDLIQALTPADIGEPQSRAHRRGIKVWFGPAKPGREHYEAQLIARHHVDGVEGMALEIGFHAEHPEATKNDAAITHLAKAEKSWRLQLGDEAQQGVFFGAPNWRRLSEAWLEPDLDDPELAFEVASRLVDYFAALEPIRG